MWLKKMLHKEGEQSVSTRDVTLPESFFFINQYKLHLPVLEHTV